VDTTLTLTLVTLAAATLSGAVGMGGGTILAAAMATLLPARSVVPLHGLIQVCSNSSRGLLLWRHIEWKILALYVPLQLAGVWVAIEWFWSGESFGWFRPTLGGFVLVAILWNRIRPRRLTVPRAVFALAGFGGGLLTVLVGVTGPWISTFFLRDDLSKEEIVATKAAIQTIGHFAKIPAFLSVGFHYRDHVSLLLPMIGASLLGTWLGTRALGRMRREQFRLAFELILGALGLKLLSGAWI
jgi:uncharacterized membrane protein YfcA